MGEAAFRENAITEKLLPSLTAGDLKDLGVSIVGHRRALLNAIADMRSDTKAEPAPKVIHFNGLQPTYRAPFPVTGHPFDTCR